MLTLVGTLSYSISLSNMFILWTLSPISSPLCPLCGRSPLSLSIKFTSVNAINSSLRWTLSLSLSIKFASVNAINIPFRWALSPISSQLCSFWGLPLMVVIRRSKRVWKKDFECIYCFEFVQLFLSFLRQNKNKIQSTSGLHHHRSYCIFSSQKIAGSASTVEMEQWNMRWCINGGNVKGVETT